MVLRGPHLNLSLKCSYKLALLQVHKYYQPYIDDELKCFLPKTECLVIETFDGNLFVTVDENIYNLKELGRNQYCIYEEKVEKK